MKRIVCLLGLTLLSQAYAAQSAKVIMVKGDVTALKPGSKSAVKVKRGMSFPEDTSILTAQKSIVRIKFADNSTMNLGPKSKVIVSKLPVKKPNMINLLTGAIKAEVNKKSNKPTANKMLIKTRSAVMGVRGTKFQAGFNPTNGNTSLVTVEGKVAMVKKKAIEKQVVKEVVKEKVIDESGKEVVKEFIKEKAVTIAEVAADPDAELDALDKALETSTDAVEVPAGRFSGVSEAAPEAAPTAPTKIAPQQYNALAKSMDSDKKAEDVFTDKELEEASKAAEGLGAAGKKAGGFVDFNTGIYVPPPKDAKIDEKTGVFIAKDVGKVDEETGDYIPPKGVKLDAKKGFVVDKEEVAKLASADKKALEKTLQKLETVNEEVKKQVVVNKMEAKSKDSGKAWWKPQQHILTANLQPYSETITANNLSSSSEADFFTEQANITEFSWGQKWSEKWSSKIGLGFVTYKIDDTDVNVQERQNDDAKVTFGAYYQYNERLNLKAELIDQAFFFVSPSGNNNVEVYSQNLTYINLGADYFLLDWKSFAVSAGGNLMVFGEDDANSTNCNNGNCERLSMNSFGWRGHLTGRYELNKTMGINATGFIERISHETDEFEWTRFALGSNVQFYYNL